jgi:two-component system, OmpR family, response regulator RegX3
MKALLVDDDRDLVEVLKTALGRVGFTVLTAYDAISALATQDTEPADIMLLDINLPGMSGLDLLRTIRQRTDLPVILLSGRSSEDDKVHGFSLGADDYLTKPFGHRELVARIGAVMRRQGREWIAPKPDDTVLDAGPISLNLREHGATLDGERLHLTVTEFRVLAYLIRNAGAVVPTTAMLRHVWGHEPHSPQYDPDVVRSTIHRLRRKLGDDPANPRFIRTVQGLGFQLMG